MPVTGHWLSHPEGSAYFWRNTMPNTAYNRHATRRIYEDNEGPYCVIPLTKGQTALISPDDFDLIALHRWCVDMTSASIWYAHRGIYLGGGRKHCKVRKRRMHHEIIGECPPRPMVVDHINGNGLDNRRGNMRVVTCGTNTQRGAPRPNPSGFIGIRHDDGCCGRPWMARISDHSKRIYLGCYSSAEEAARVYDAAARRLHGQHARANFPDES